MDEYKMLIGGELVDAASGKTMQVFDPGNGEPVAEVPCCDERDVDAAVGAAREAFDSGIWSARSPSDRADIMFQFADLIEVYSGRIGLADSRSMGNTLGGTAGGMWVACNSMRNLAWYAAHKFPWERTVEHSGSIFAFGENVIRREPIGVCAAIAPWNVPGPMAMWKITHALVMGNTLVLKPASSTPISALIIAELAHQAGIPKGVLNVITGPGGTVGDALCSHPGVDKISLTGSSEVGKQIMERAAMGLKQVTLELGGKSANIILDDADLDVAVDGAIAGIFANCGQICISGSRLLLSRKVHDRFIERLMQRIQQIIVGYQLLPDTKMGPLSSRKQLETVERYVDIGKAEGATVACGGHRLTGAQYDKGCFFAPTVLTGVTNAMRVAREEIFGPVLVVIPFDSDAEAVAIANDSDYGLAGSIYSTDSQRARKLANQVRTGILSINDIALLSDFTPFGGYKSSGIGREFGEDGLTSYTQIKTIYTSSEGSPNRATFGMMFNFPKGESFVHTAPTKVVCGPKVLASLNNELRALGARRAVIITDPGVRAAGLVDRAAFAASDRCAGVFDGVVADPTYECAQAAVDYCRSVGADSIVSLGGGSSIDCAKLALVALTNGCTALQAMNIFRLEGPQLPHIAIPTTHGTGSEVTCAGVITNSRLHKKFFIVDLKLFPNTAILDPTLVTGLPRSMTVGTGMDALTHAIESVVNPSGNPVSVAVGLQSIRMIKENLPRVVADGADLVARQNMLAASTLAGIALGPGLGIAHCLAHTVGTLFGIHHGTGCGIALPAAMRFNRDHATARLGEVALAMGVNTRDMSPGDAADAAAEAVEALMKAIGQPLRVSELIPMDKIMASFEQIVAGTMGDGSTMFNPRPVNDPAAVAAFIQSAI
ncbi:MAG: aldehyde dehydrogenase family protein [Rhodocyclaceae bacterium]|jgi:aldehyde dehydrogenase (NAD+)|nr:aldehyde dehydrogenase family protein [Rhodocyclaceae bacterium]MBK6554125.1 aldehyde dehydrogenase family protein [Rhodocyclaceae bacterium]MBK9310592.1 aldehyde dehydrogenase family protein [Rhodocyclaceae bacterium]MBK9954337.1 aldehyde dehydrogenase family protein [Rhodocyclaceae bacterium]